MPSRNSDDVVVRVSSRSPVGGFLLFAFCWTVVIYLLGPPELTASSLVTWPLLLAALALSVAFSFASATATTSRS